MAEVMSSTKIYLTRNINTHEVSDSLLLNYNFYCQPVILTIIYQDVIKKVITKDKLFNELSRFFAKKECAIHNAMRHPNIVELFEYTETPKEYIMYMELADQGDYLSKKILDVNH